MTSLSTLLLIISLLLLCLPMIEVDSQILSALRKLFPNVIGPDNLAYSEINDEDFHGAPGIEFSRPFSNFDNYFHRLDPGTPRPQASGRDELYPSDCGRNQHDGTGKLCFPDPILCANRMHRSGIREHENRLYWISWGSFEPSVKDAKWSWFNGRNYCRKRCMDLVSIETIDEYQWIKEQMRDTQYVWTSGRLCNFEGCDRADFLPKQIHGWFWAGSEARLAATNDSRAFHDWSFTGGSGFRQPDNREGREGGEVEACLAVLNNFYGDGIKWHDVACEHEKPIICEDNEAHLQFARQAFPNVYIP